MDIQYLREKAKKERAQGKNANRRINGKQKRHKKYVKNQRFFRENLIKSIT